MAAGSGRGAKPLLRPSQSIAATARRSAERALLARPVVEVPAPAPTRRRALATFVAAAVAVCLVGASVVYYRYAERATESPQLADQQAPAPRSPVAEGPSVLPPQLAPKSVSETTSPAAESAASVSSSGETAKPEPPKRPSSRRVLMPDAVAPVLEPLPPPAVATAPVVAAPPPVREAPPVDALQQMRDSLARCNGDLIDRILCDQRVRREYCATRWGLVPQCPSGVANDRGQ
ncbi:MAG: hypothetical protein ABI981_08665 [Betaproteobacteria bacterium]